MELIIKIGLSFFTGGVTAVGGIIGGYLANSVMVIASDFGNYVYFDKEHGWNKDHPDREDAGLGEKFSTMVKEAKSK